MSQNQISNDKPIVLKSYDDVKIRSNARSFAVNVIKVRDKMKTISIKSGSVVANALDKAGIEVDTSDLSKLDIRVNGQKGSSLLQVLNENDTVYIASKVDGAGY